MPFIKVLIHAVWATKDRKPLMNKFNKDALCHHMKEYAKGQGYPFSYVLDNNSVMADAFGATRTPEVFLFDKSGKLVYHGAIDDNSNDPGEVTRKHAAIAIDEMVAGKAVSTTKTRFVGCGIKRL